MTPTQTGRNHRCPCGSGRKYKHCCLQHRHEGDAARRRLRLAEGRIVDGTLAFAAATWGEALLHDAWADFWNDEAPDDRVGTPEFEQMFLPWFVFSYVPDRGLPFEERRAHALWPERPLALEWMAAHAGPRDPLDRQYAETAARSPLSVFVVEGVVPGESIDLRDVLTGAHFHVLERYASRSLRAADLLFASVLTLDGVSVMFGASPYVVPADWHTRIIDWREGLQKRKWVRRTLVEYDIEIRALYVHIREALLNPTPPQLQNTDGDPLEMITLRFDLTVSVAEAFERLLPLATVGDEQHVSDVTPDDTDAMSHAEMSWITVGNRRHASWDNTVLGRLVLDPGELVAEVNSSKRATRLMKEIRTRLGAGARLVDRRVLDLEAELLEHRSGHGAEAETTAAGVTAPELQALNDEMTRRHWISWLDERVPALGNKTPRQAARTAKGRERLEALLGGFSQKAESDSESTREALREVRRQLGLE